MDLKRYTLAKFDPILAYTLYDSYRKGEYNDPETILKLILPMCKIVKERFYRNCQECDYDDYVARAAYEIYKSIVNKGFTKTNHGSFIAYYTTLIRIQFTVAYHIGYTPPVECRDYLLSEMPHPNEVLVWMYINSLPQAAYKTVQAAIEDRLTGEYRLAALHVLECIKSGKRASLSIGKYAVHDMYFIRDLVDVLLRKFFMEERDDIHFLIRKKYVDAACPIYSGCE